ncbi:DUF222 domain-containing protein [Leifsonia poae]|uniref:DUF222 domain-containing protein n=1 Tax=Leifsonia poae TaxID=110933 RepID=UPI003D67FCCD
MTATESVALLREALQPFATPASLGQDEFSAALAAVGDLQAALDAVKVGLARELVARSTGAGATNPVLRTGHSSAANLIAEQWQISMPAARQYCQVGEATAPVIGPDDAAGAARFPAVAAAIEASSGWVSVDQAAVIVRELDKAASGCTPASLHAGERVLVERAPDLTYLELRALAERIRDELDEGGIVPGEERQRMRRSLTIGTTSDGMTHLDWYLNPESAGFVVTAIDSLVGHELRRVRFPESGQPQTEVSGMDGMEDRRSLPQLRSDMAVQAFRHFAGCSQTGPAGRAPVAVVVRVDLETLQTGLGTASIDGIRSPISAGTARRMAADADLIPVVLGGASEVLDLGRRQRLFSPAQKLALAERDDGCAWTGCPHPPSYTEAHHIRWWDAHTGPTDLSNGILLCSTHHHRVHDDGWQIHVRDNVPYFTPPPHIDPHQRPRPGGRIRMARTS